MFDKWGWQAVGDYRSCSNPHRAPGITPNSQGQNVPSLLAENISISESRMTQFATHQTQNAWCNPCVTLMLPRDRWVRPHLPGKATCKGIWVSQAWKCDSTSCCWLWAFTALLQPQLLSTLGTETTQSPNVIHFDWKQGGGEAARTGASKSQHGGPTRSKPCSWVRSKQ